MVHTYIHTCATTELQFRIKKGWRGRGRGERERGKGGEREREREANQNFLLFKRQRLECAAVICILIKNNNKTKNKKNPGGLFSMYTVTNIEVLTVHIYDKGQTRHERNVLSIVR